jgi:hypothetical protein
MFLFLLIIPDFVGEGVFYHKYYNYGKIDYGWLNIKLFKVKIYHNIIILLNQSDFN